MLNFSNLSHAEFLRDYWQKKPLLIRSAFPRVECPVTANELAGLALETEIESRIVIYQPQENPSWLLKTGPFSKKEFKKLPTTNWTLLVQGVDRFIPEVSALLDYFSFIPPWRIDDVMISYAVEHGSVGPHYDNYDVFLYQAQGCRHWLLTSKGCVESNYLSGLDLRIMKDFKVEAEYILEEGDMLYLPPSVGHHGISLSKDCMTYSFGYRSYQGQELWDSFGEYLASSSNPPLYYKDPSWTDLTETSCIPKKAWLQAKVVMQDLLNDEELFKEWFGSFATSLDRHAESILPQNCDDEPALDLEAFKQELLNSYGLIKNSLCRFAYIAEPSLALYINGCKWNIEEVNLELIKLMASRRVLNLASLLPFIDKFANLSFLHELWLLEWLEFLEEPV